MSDIAFMLSRAALGEMLARLGASHRLIGPKWRDEAIVYDDIEGIENLPAGWGDAQAPGRYRLVRRDDEALFGYAVGPQSWKTFLHPPVERLFTARREADQNNFSVQGEDPKPARPFAFFGVRACELAAIAIQDRVLMQGAYRDEGYAARRREAFIVAVNCGTAGGTCFCVSMQTGPRAETGFDIALTEFLAPDRHEFLAEAGSLAGATMLEALGGRAATAADFTQAETIVAETARHMGRELETQGLPEALRDKLTHPHWEEVASRCLGCANCTAVCPTCFCTNVRDHTDLAGETATRERVWDSCFTLDHSYLHGGHVRASGAARYRQWLTHKLSSWVEQFGSSGCVGCGRCISWCPVGIDITEEAAKLRESP